MSVLLIHNKTRQHLKVGAGSIFSKIAKEVLPGWELSLVFVGPAKAKKLNETLRGKHYIPNVLSYEVGEKSGEIIICPNEAKRQAPEYGMPEERFTLFLFIHGLLHIKGWVHGATMEICERELLERFSPLSNGTENRNWH
jgi:probable rRNA maturation factor